MAFTSDLTGRARDGGDAETATAVLLLLLAGATYAILIFAPISPLGPALAGLVFLVLSLWALVGPESYAGVWPAGATGEGFDLSLPGDALAALLAVPMLSTALNARRWERYEPAQLPLIGTIGRALGTAAAPGTAMAAERTTVLPGADPTEVVTVPASRVPASGGDGPTVVTGTADEPTAVVAGPAGEPTAVVAGPDESTMVVPDRAAPDEPTIVVRRTEQEPAAPAEAGEGEPTAAEDGKGGPTVAAAQNGEDEPTAAEDGEDGRTVAAAQDGEDEPTAAAARDSEEEPTAEVEDEPAESVTAETTDETAEVGAERDAGEAIEPVAAGAPSTPVAEPAEARAGESEEAEPTQQVTTDAGDEPIEQVTAEAGEPPTEPVTAEAGEPPAERITAETDEDEDERTQVVRRPAAADRNGAALIDHGGITQVLRTGDTTEVIFRGGPSEPRTMEQLVRNRAAAEEVAREWAAQERARQAFRELAAQERARRAFEERAARAAREVGEETQVIGRIPDRIPDDRTQVIPRGGGTVEPPGERTQVLNIPVRDEQRTAGQEPPARSSSIVEQERPDPGADPTTRLVPPRRRGGTGPARANTDKAVTTEEPEDDTVADADRTERPRSVLDLERPADEVTDDTRRLPKQRRPETVDAEESTKRL